MFLVALIHSRKTVFGTVLTTCFLPARLNIILWNWIRVVVFCIGIEVLIVQKHLFKWNGTLGTVLCLILVYLIAQLSLPVGTLISLPKQEILI